MGHVHEIGVAENTIASDIELLHDDLGVWKSEQRFSARAA
eukprot:CAMPEP_0183583128 /NCGR_PEP_ID=MMETSP0371-20130417/151002_1 /TAXON_ID=268820 /ORGANISM="Peridinium aciculiferum, Strain PAER-2" /LENGTH=39 /DNA_ID= /DNA_START= /DNA_END= /DNA_ORIENTATION=